MSSRSEKEAKNLKQLNWENLINLIVIIQVALVNPKCRLASRRALNRLTVVINFLNLVARLVGRQLFNNYVLDQFIILEESATLKKASHEALKMIQLVRHI